MQLPSQSSVSAKPEALAKETKLQRIERLTAILRNTTLEELDEARALKTMEKLANVRHFFNLNISFALALR